MKYDVFLSFRGEDTRNSFTDHLYVALKQRGIVTFRDEEKLEKGKSIAPELLKAIEESRFVIVVLSKNYASSTWCLDELVKIIECMREMKTTVLPIFYDVDPSNVRKQTGTFVQAFSEHEERFKDCVKKVQTWRDALTEVANLNGWHLLNRPESKFIQEIVGDLWHRLSYAFEDDTEDLVGIESRLKELESCLAIGSNDVRIIGVWGMGGIGKTTIAKVFYRRVSKKFEGFCFLSNVRDICAKDGLIPLQQQLIREILNENMSVRDVDEGAFLIRNKLRHIRILLVLDDVNQLDQLKKLAGKHSWFGSGSRVIITTRNKQLLQIIEADKIYEVEGLNDDEALRLLSLKAFKKDHPPEDYLVLSKDVVYYAKGLPLAIEILGSSLLSRDINQWKSTLNKLKEFPKIEILEVLKISFDGLDEAEKEIFLHVACFFNNEIKNDVVEILDHLDLYPDIGLVVLFDKSLIKVDGDRLWMHDLLQEMGKNIVYQKFPKKLGKRSRLWLFEDINNVLTKNMGTEATEGIVLKLLEPKEAFWTPESFSKMHNLKLLIIDNVRLLRDPKHLPNSLRFLDWSGYPSKYFPSSFELKSFERLKFIRLSKSLKLTETPDLSEIPILEKLILEDCLNLLGVHPSIGVHKKLKVLNLKGCKSLKTLPRKFEMESLEILILSDCSKVNRISEFGENMENVLELHLDGTAITKLSTSIGYLTCLALLKLRNCRNLMSLPSNFFNMKSLKNLDLFGCSKLADLLENMGIDESVEELDESGTAIRSMPSSNALFPTLKKIAFDAFKGLSSTNNSWYKLHSFYSMPRTDDPMGLLSTSFSGLCSLTKLNLSYCNLKAIPNDICCLLSLRHLNISGNDFGCLPDSIAQISTLKYLYVTNCTSLQSLPKLPLNIDHIKGFGCTSLETVPDLLNPNSLCEPKLYLSNCSKLADNQGFIGMFFAAIKKYTKDLSLRSRYEMFIPGSEIPGWFSHQITGAEISIQEPSSHLCNEWMGFATCVVICPHHQVVDYFDLDCSLIFNGKDTGYSILTHAAKVSSDHLWLLYFPPQILNRYLGKLLWECDVNGFIQFGVRIGTDLGVEVKKCGLRMVYKKDTEDLNRTMAQCSNNNNITLYHNFDNLAIVAEGNKVNQSHDDYDRAGPSGEGSCNDLSDTKRIEMLTEFITHGNSDCEESSEYEECGEELSDWEESSEGGQEG